MMHLGETTTDVTEVDPVPQSENKDDDDEQSDHREGGGDVTSDS